MNEEPEKLEDIEVEIPNDVDAIYAADIAYRLSMINRLFRCIRLNLA